MGQSRLNTSAGPRFALTVAVLSLAALGIIHFSSARPTNFGGYDEWLILSLAPRGIVDLPYANRPLMLLWHLPVTLLTPYNLTAYLVLHVSYLILAAVGAMFAFRGVLRGDLAAAYAAAALGLVWAPTDDRRLSSVQMLAYSGFTCATMWALALFVASWRRRSVPVLIAAALLGYAASLSYEGVFAMVMAGPFLLLRNDDWRAAHRWLWTGVWIGVMLVPVGQLAFAAFSGDTQTAYQTGLGLDLRPHGILSRLGQQFWFHAAPLATLPSGGLRNRPVWLASGLFVLTVLFLDRLRTGLSWNRNQRALVGVVGRGLGLAALGLAVLVLSAGIRTPSRAQFLSAPGFGLALTGCLELLGSFVLGSHRRMGVLVLGAWVVAAGTARTAAWQLQWDTESAYRRQSRLLRELTAFAADLKPNTLVVLRCPEWNQTFPFRHAVEALYEGHAVGHVWKGRDFLYGARFSAEGVTVKPWPVIEKAWQQTPTTHRYEELFVVECQRGGPVRLREDWPSDMPALPATQVYAPRSRIVTRTSPRPAFDRVLRY